MKPALEDLMGNAFSGMTNGPRSLMAAITFYAQQDKVEIGEVEQQLLQRVPSNPNDVIRKLLNSQLKQWDWESSAPWTSGTKANTSERRQRIYELLQISGKLRTVLDEYVPHYEGLGNIVVDNPLTPKDWYTFEIRKNRDFYWKHLRSYLGKIRQIPAESLSSMDAATTTILERLADPAAHSPRGARGLIVGYVQSGKTTNFTGVIAKAIDAGYRLIIVLSGTTNLLRNQTQRRLDMDLVGVENILKGAEEYEVEHDYKVDQDWPAKFISHGKRPSLLGHTDITRLTGQQDFQSPLVGINPLEFEFEKKNKQVPLYVHENLDHAGARIVVVKKQRDRLVRLLRDLKAVGGAKCSEIPTLVIDDESDQASINTINPAKVTDNQTRSRINDLIVDILKRLPRAQYLGYTATPFANVFVSLKDPADIYPKDFILSLDPPAGYMGAREFHNFEATPTGRLSNEAVYIRGIPNPDKKSSDVDRLEEAIDAFVLTGALKKFRKKFEGSNSFKHHTMLVNQSQLKGHHKVTVQEIHTLWEKAAYDSPGQGMKRLRDLLENFRITWIDRGKVLGLKFPNDFEELKPALGAALTEMRRGDPVLMVNSAEGAEVPNFDAKEGVWKIIVGGAKLSRGYTIEGLTISYFRRSSKVQDTLMQMGRWFGFRKGYEDLVRLYVGTAEPIGKDKTLDLYKAFEAMCRDEEDFRAQLAMYVDGSGITPSVVPALVFNSHPKLRPTARNRMFNAEVTWAAFTYREPTTQSVSPSGRNDNSELFKQLFLKCGVQTAVVKSSGSPGRQFGIKWCKAPHKDVLRLLNNFSWEKTGSEIKAEIKYLGENECPVDSWIVLAPQVREKIDVDPWSVGDEVFRCVERTRLPNRFNAFSSPEHRNFAKWLVGGTAEKFDSPKLKQNTRTGVLLLYPTQEMKDTKKAKKAKPGLPVMGFALVLPADSSQLKRVVFTLRKKSDPNAVVVNVS